VPARGIRSSAKSDVYSWADEGLKLGNGSGNNVGRGRSQCGYEHVIGISFRKIQVEIRKDDPPECELSNGELQPAVRGRLPKLTVTDAPPRELVPDKTYQANE